MRLTELPLFEDRHRELERLLEQWCGAHLRSSEGTDVDEACRWLVRAMGEAGWLRHAVAGREYGGASDELDVRAICLIRQILARHWGLADFAFAMQGLGSGPITLFGSPDQKARYLPRVAAGQAIAAFALSEPEAGSDAAALRCRAVADGDGYVLDGQKTWVSNGGIAHFYVVFARTGDEPGAAEITAFVVDADAPGLEVTERIEVIAPHPLVKLTFRECRVPRRQVLGAPGEGFRIAMSTLDVFRSSVAAAAVGFAERALQESVDRATSRVLFGQRLAEFQLTRTRLAEMATRLEASALLTYRAAWTADRGRRVTREAAMAKVFSTESAQQIIDAAVQIWGGLGVTRGQIVESLYREIRALRIYEGATELLQLVVGRELVREWERQAKEMRP
jgi:alkylation response protein AidB-like acyl-CoA dehydrogenase